MPRRRPRRRRPRKASRCASRQPGTLLIASAAEFYEQPVESQRHRARKPESGSRESRSGSLPRLPNELTDAIVELVHTKDRIVVVDPDAASDNESDIGWMWMAGRKRRNDMTNLALASRRFLPFVRPRLLETVDLSSASKIEEVIRWLEAVTPEERLVIRHLHIVGVNLELGKSGDNITQQRLAHLLWLLPGIRTLSIALWSSSQLQPALKLALGRLASLDSFSFHSKNKSPPAFAILASLPSLRLDRLVLKLHYFDGENAVSFPATLAPRHLDAGVWTGGGLSNQLARGSLVSVGARLAALEVPSRYLSPSILASLAPTLRALALDWTIAGKTLDVVLPRLEVVALDGSMELNRRFSSNRRDIDQPIHSIPLLRHVATLAWDETPPATQVMQLFLAGHQHLRRLLYGEAWRRNDASMAALRAAMPGTEVVSVSRSGQLDLSALLDTGEYVQRNTSYHFQ